MKSIFLVLAALALATGCDLTSERGPEEVKIKGESAVWTVETGGTINYAGLVSRQRIPAGTELRILIEKVGSEGNLQLSNWENRTEVQAWTQDALTPTQVLSYRVTESSRYALDVGGVNFWKDPKAVSDESDGTSLFLFDSGWRMRVKLIPKPF